MATRQRIDKSDFIRQYLNLGGDCKAVATHYGTTRESIINRARAVNRSLAEVYEDQSTPEGDRVFLPLPKGGKPGAPAADPLALVALVKQLTAPPVGGEGVTAPTE